MHRAVLEALIPAFVALAIGFVLLRLVLRISGARLNLKRIRRIHSCETGAVQSLAFVLTLPLFIMIVMFIVQVSQLMMGIMGVHYAAFAAARAATVWSAARVNSYQAPREFENVLEQPLSAGTPAELLFDGDGAGQLQPTASTSYKLNKVFGAAVTAVAPVAPSRAVVEPVDCSSCGVKPWAVRDWYLQLVPSSASNGRIPQRLINKMSYAYWNTRVDMRFVDRDTREGPTYNPRELVIVDGTAVMADQGEWLRDWTPHEIGWQDQLTLTVTHDFALLPGPGRFLAKYIVRADGRADTVAPRIALQGTLSDSVPWIVPTYTTQISASATLTNEGFKPLLAYEQELE